jgi:hypothetical protein
MGEDEEEKEENAAKGSVLKSEPRRFSPRGNASQKHVAALTEPQRGQ